MILRIEDTDAERNKPELVQGILDGLQWLGVNWDEGPFYQSQRTELYRAAAKKCLANGAAFLCYCPAEKYAARGLRRTGARRGAEGRRAAARHALFLPRWPALNAGCEAGRPLQSSAR